MVVGFSLKRPAGVGMSWLNGLCGGADRYSLGMLQKLLGTKVKTLPPSWQCHHIFPAALCINQTAGTHDDTQTHRQLVHSWYIIAQHFLKKFHSSLCNPCTLMAPAGWEFSRCMGSYIYGIYRLNSMSCSVLK